MYRISVTFVLLMANEYRRFEEELAICVLSLYSRLAAGYDKVKVEAERGRARPSASFKSEDVSPRT
jgi:hypothetical protein